MTFNDSIKLYHYQKILVTIMSHNIYETDVLNYERVASKYDIRIVVVRT